MKITVAVHGRYHAFELARGLHAHGHLDRLLTTYPAFAVKKVTGANLPVSSAPLLELRRRLHGRFGFGEAPDFAIAEAFAKFTARNLAPHAGLLIGWSSATLEAIAPAQAMGTKVIIERGSTHIVHQARVLGEAYQASGLKFGGIDPRVIAREVEEYERADMISVPSTHAAQTFVSEGVAEQKVLVNSLGVDLSQFSAPADRPINSKPRIIFAGGVGVRKGVPQLLSAFASLSGKAELHIFGRLEPGFDNRLTGEGVIVHGPVPAGTLADEYAKADIFCLPSIEEGFGLVVAQAMASGLPVVISDAVGAGDLITEGQDGLIVPAMDDAALGEALAELVDDPERRRSMGEAARLKVASGCGWDDYVERAIINYQRII